VLGVVSAVVIGMVLDAALGRNQGKQSGEAALFHSTSGTSRHESPIPPARRQRGRQ
jgi:hypothetical protein